MHSTLLAILADTYTPYLVFSLFWILWRHNPNTSKNIGSKIKEITYYLYHQKKAYLKAVGVGLMLILICQQVDDWFGIWLKLGLDYSTHTALAWLFVLPLFYACSAKQSKFVAFQCLSVLLYGGLMKLLHYHSWVDMLSTTLVIVPILLSVNHYYLSRTLNH